MTDDKRVVHLSGRVAVPPRRVEKTYRKHKVTVVYDPATSVWRWSFKHVFEVGYEDFAPTVEQAFRAAYARVDKVEDGA